ncbi:MAG: serine protease [Proteobacteria bacterium]|nr:serine protease [Pseudomonadota bacterium]MBU1140616.1 serine protease [Pseudomonadota bacterium]MBU1232736.1 serine protease [Pseudomonadota bacterium]MBU1417422.1 serine protease [Pseudomonadota bacterium]
MNILRFLLILIFFAQPVFADEIIVDSEKILGGIESKTGDWPWITAIMYADEADMYNAQFCAGVLIDDTWVVTAAHCVVGQTTSAIDVAVGVYDLSNYSGSRIAVKSIRVHPQYNANTSQNDIALLELNQPSSQTTLPLFSGQPDVLGEMVTAIGWGMADDGIFWYYPEKLRQVDLPVVADSYCNNIYPTPLIASQLCAGYYEGKDVCNGDSGGPIVAQIEGAWVHVGLVSYGTTCADYNGWYGVYTRTSELISFVKQYVPDVSVHPQDKTAVLPFLNTLLLD